MKTTIGEVISRVRNLIKAVNQDSFLTDRFIYSVIKKHTSWLLKREDGLNKLMRYISAFDTLELVELIEVDKIAASCAGIKSGCLIMRSHKRLPRFMEGYWGPLIRTVMSLDNSVQLYPTTAASFTKLANSKNFKYNKTKYYWIEDGYIYLPNVVWNGIKIEGIFDDDISDYSCDPNKSCIQRQNQPFNLPEYLTPELETYVLKDMGFMLNVPADLTHDKENPLR